MKTSNIIALVALGLTIMFLALITVWKPFCLFASLTFLVVAGILSYNVLKNYIRQQAELKEQRLVDAYLDADAKRTEMVLKDFRYDKKVERSLRRDKHNRFTSVFTLSVMFIFAIIMLVISIKIVFF